ncbi:AMP-binding protein [Spirosoma endbachense]|uniref:AMP-binding protein n=1 Tax=Spirosoma endbachense TaxID=2666025 RepID=A0A6P1VQQ9_9BACT|nr:AMP-binding protein [Spirosoma endbachense]QHV94748.1 AMP-binding protein [Spirosoma endbachense]
MIVNPLLPDSWPTPDSAYEAETLEFCQAWLSGQTSFILHTSGSTGTPKPITLTRAQMRASAHLTGQTLGLQMGDKALVCLNIRYVAGVMMLVRGLELGMTMTVVEPSGNPLAAFESDQTHFDFTALVPLQLQTILETIPQKLPILNEMKAILVGGAATSPILERALQAIDAPIFATYGMTETVSHVALRRLNGPMKSDFFTALDGVVLGTDERECLHITAAATKFERIQTNDVVELLREVEPNQFRLLGRADTIINTGGVKVQPEQVERVVQDTLALFGQSSIGQLEAIPRLFVAGLTDDRLGQRIAVIFEQKLLSSDQFGAVQEAVRRQLGPYAVPKAQITVSQFAETPTGKVDRNATIARIP